MSVNQSLTPAVAPPAADDATPVEAASQDTSGSRYDEELEAILLEASGGQKAAEPTGLLDGESYDSIYASATPEMKRLMAQMRGDYTRKTQSLAEQRKEIEMQARQLSQSQAYKKIVEKAQAEQEELDPWDPSSVSSRIEAEVAKRLSEILEPMRREQEAAESVQKYQSFISANPDLESDAEIKKGVYDALQANPSLDLETAYYAVKGRVLSGAERRAKDRLAAERAAAKAAALSTGVGTRAGSQSTSSLKGLSAIDIYERMLAAKG